MHIIFFLEICLNLKSFQTCFFSNLMWRVLQQLTAASQQRTVIANSSSFFNNGKKLLHKTLVTLICELN